ncbi:MAG: hypothetical protein ACYC6L_15245, partial [Anaerolineae bacterium]
MKPQVFPISFWVQPENTYENWKTVAECGFTVVPVTATSVKDGLQVLDWLKEFGIYGMIHEPRVNALMTEKRGWKDIVQEVVDAYHGHPALWGYYVTDEPGYERFENLAKIIKAFQKADPEHTAFINLFPNYASPDQLGTISYDRHVAAYLDIVKPDILSYDHYALLENGDRPEYFPNLETIRAEALRAGIPFMNIFLSTPHFNYRDPSAVDMRWQVYTSLAYGAKAIAYFTYVTPDVENYRNGPLSIYGFKTPKWDIIRQLNFEVGKLGPWLSGLTSTLVYHVGTVPDGSDALCGCGVVAEAKSSSGELLIGEFIDGDKNPWVIVMNKNREHAGWVSLKLRTKLTKLHEVARTTGDLRAIARDQGADAYKKFEDGLVVQFWLAPGDARVM